MALEIFKNLDRTKKIFLLFWYVIVMFWIMLNFFFQFYRKEKFKISKLKISGTEAEFKSSEEDKDETIFDKDIKELVYIIANSGTEIIVFEDLDRYDNPNIFIKLRELNFLVNKYNETNGIRHTVKFIYMVKDGMFTAKDRVKFFDFIIPIIPVVDSNNSSAILTNLLKNFGYELDDDIIFKISLYIDDMRLLKNIANEFNTYYNVVLKEKIENEDADKIKKEERYKEDISKLFALIVVKNVVPDEFDSLLLDDGYIYYIMNNKKEYIELYKNYINERISELLNNDNIYSHEKLVELQLNLYNSNLKSIKEIFEEIPNDELDKIYNKNKLKNKKYLKLIKMLICEGFIDETYRYYISIYHKGDLGKNDKLYLKNLYSNTEQDINLELENPEKILSKLEDDDFKRFNILNKKLFEICIKNLDDNRKKFIYMSAFYDNNYINKLIEILKYLEKDLLRKYIQFLLLDVINLSNDYIAPCNFIEDILTNIKNKKENKSMEDIEIYNYIIYIIYSLEITKENFINVQSIFNQFVYEPYTNIFKYIKSREEELLIYNNLKEEGFVFKYSSSYYDDDKEKLKSRISEMIDKELFGLTEDNLLFLITNNYDELTLKLILKNRVLMQDIIEKNNLLKEINEDLVIYLANSEIDEEEIVELIKAKNLKNSIDKSKIDKSKTKILKYLEGSETPDVIEETE